MSNGNTFDGPSTTGGLPFGFPQVRAVVLAETGTHGVLDARLGGYQDGERRLAYQLADSTSSGDLVIADRGFWSVESARVFTVTGADLLVRLQSNHLGTLQEELPDGSYLSMSRPGKEVRLRAGREGRTLPSHTIYRVITFTKDDKVAFLGTTLLDREQYPAAELVALYRERWEIELAFDEIKNHLGPGSPIRSRPPEGVRQDLWPYIAVHHAIRRFAHTAALSGPALDTDRVSLSEVRPDHPPKRSVPARSQYGQAHPVPHRGWARGTKPLARSPPEPEVPTGDQEAQPLARAADPSKTRRCQAGPLGPQPDDEGQDQPTGGKTDA